MKWTLPALWLVFASGLSYAADDMQQRAANSAGGVLEVFGTEEGLSQNAMQPLSSDKEMRTVDGQTFKTQLDCPASQEYMRVTILPSSDNDIQYVSVDMDKDFDGTYEFANLFAGPFAAVCNNGLLACRPGTSEDCVGRKWASNGSGVELLPVQREELGACYCINQSCGDSLIVKNSEKIINDLGAGIVTAMHETHPRLNITQASQPDPYTQVFMGSESGCGADRSPEQYYANQTGMNEAGVDAQNDPDSVAYLVNNSQLNQDHGYAIAECEVNRSIVVGSNLVDEGAVITQADGKRSTCGERCTNIEMGKYDLNGPIKGGSCELVDYFIKLDIEDTEAVQSFMWRDGWYGDWLELSINGVPVWVSHGGSMLENSSTPGKFKVHPDGTLANCNVGMVFGGPSSLELKKYLKEGSNTVRVRVGIDLQGYLYSNFRLITKEIERCELKAESVINDCIGIEAKDSCRLQSEIIDGVQTLEDYYNTGLQPTASTRTIWGDGCSLTFTRDWWQKKRTYICATDPPKWDMKPHVEREQHVYESLDTTTGSYSDRRCEEGDCKVSGESITLPPAATDDGKTPMCKVRRPRPGAEMGLNGATTKMNNTGLAWDYGYRECVNNNCPLLGNEELVEDCNTGTTFAEAAVMMQTIRMVGQDTICEPN